MAEIAEHHLKIAKNWFGTWKAGLSLPAEEFLAVYSKDILWYDHFFGLHLAGTAAVEQLRQRWLGAHDDYDIEEVDMQPTATGAVVQLINKGVFVRDLLPKRKASGKKFACHACYVLRINDEGKISRVDEYQPTYFDDQYYTEGYVFRDGGAVAGSS